MSRLLNIKIIFWAVFAVMAVAGLFIVQGMYAHGQATLGSVVLIFMAIILYVYAVKAAYTWRYLLPGIAGMLLFVALPLVYTVGISFTNYGSKNLLSFEQVKKQLLEQTYQGEGKTFDAALYQDGEKYRLVLTARDEGDAAAAEDSAAAPTKETDSTSAAQPAPEGDSMFAGSNLSSTMSNMAKAKPKEKAASPVADPQVFVTDAIDFSAITALTAVKSQPIKSVQWQPANALATSELVKKQSVLQKLSIQIPDGTEIAQSGLSEFSPHKALFIANADGTLKNQQNGSVYFANMKTGFFETAAGEAVIPGFKVGVGLSNYLKIFSDPNFRGPFFQIFLWNVVFALLTVLFTLVVGGILAVLLNWEGLGGRVIYRTLLFLPYAVPGFISILVWKGLFNQNSGEINLLLSHILGMKPQWFADPFLAKVMILIVNTWLGYPYVMILCTGLIKAIPGDLYEASAIAGAGPLVNFSRITAPLIVKPLTPLLISSFAFNFNNFVLIALLTNGRPDIVDAKIPAGTTDILVSYTYRIAFSGGQDYALAAAISTLIFFLVAGMSYANLRLTKAAGKEG